jgi:hypothetical protein
MATNNKKSGCCQAFSFSCVPTPTFSFPDLAFDPGSSMTSSDLEKPPMTFPPISATMGPKILEHGGKK